MMPSSFNGLNKEKKHLIESFCSDLNVEKCVEEELIQNLERSLHSVYASYDAMISSKKNGTHHGSSIPLPPVDQSWYLTFTGIWESKVNDLENKVDLNKLVAIFKICIIQVSDVLKGYCDRQNGSVGKRIPLYSRLLVLEAPIVNFINKFVAKARELNNHLSSNFLNMISDLSSIYLEHKVLLLRLKNNQETISIKTDIDSLFQTVYPESIEPRLDTFLKCESLNNLVAGLICPLLYQTLDHCRRVQNKADYMTFSTYAKFILLYARLYKLYKQAKLDSELVLEQARFLKCQLTVRAQQKMESLLQVRKQDLIKKNRKTNEMYILNVKSVTRTCETLKALPLKDQLEKLPSQSLVQSRKRRKITQVDINRLKLLVNQVPLSSVQKTSTHSEQNVLKEIQTEVIQQVLTEQKKVDFFMRKDSIVPPPMKNSDTNGSTLNDETINQLTTQITTEHCQSNSNEYEIEIPEQQLIQKDADFASNEKMDHFDDFVSSVGDSIPMTSFEQSQEVQNETDLNPNETEIPQCSNSSKERVLPADEQINGHFNDTSIHSTEQVIQNKMQSPCIEEEVSTVNSNPDSLPGNELENNVDKLLSGKELILYSEFETMYNCKPDLQLFLQRLEAKMIDPLVNIYNIVNVEQRSYRDVLSSFVMDSTINLKDQTWTCKQYFDYECINDTFTLHEITSFFYIHNYMCQIKFYKQAISANEIVYPLSYIAYEPQCSCAHCLHNTNKIEEYCIDLFLYFKTKFDTCPVIQDVESIGLKIKHFADDGPKYEQYMQFSEEIRKKALAIIKRKEELVGHFSDIDIRFLDYCVVSFWEVFIGHTLEIEYYPHVMEKEKYKPLKKRFKNEE